MLVYECLMIMLMLCKSSYARLTPRVLQYTWWLAHLSKGREDRVEKELNALVMG